MDRDVVRRPCFKSSVEPVVDLNEGLFLFREGLNLLLSSEIYPQLAPLLDGANDVDAIFGALSPRFESAEIYHALNKLRRDGYLADDAAEMPRAERAFWENASAAPGEAQSRLAQTVVGLKGIGDVDIAPLDALLRQNGVCLADDGTASPDLTVCVADNYLSDALRDWNAQAMVAGQPWILVKPHGLETWLGPAFVPGRTACWECLAHRLRWHRRIETYVKGAQGDAFAGVPAAHLPSSCMAGLAEAATEIARWIGVGGASPLENCVLSTDLTCLERKKHVLTRRPQCPVCGSQTATKAEPILLTSAPKLKGADGGHRSQDQAQVAADLQKHLSPITGIVGTLETGPRMQGLNGVASPLVTYSADHNFNDMHEDRFFLVEGMRRRSGGKGKTAQQAKLSALAESLERYCGVYDGTEPKTRATFEALGEAAIHPNDCMLYSADQYAARDTLNQKSHKAHWVPRVFEPTVEIDWSPLWSLTQARVRYLPTSYCYFGYRSVDPIFARGDSNGCAAGATREEAILQGLLELIERDAVAIWWYNRLERPALDLSRAQDPYVHQLVASYSALNREVWVLDLTSDFEIPVFAAVSRRTDKAQEDIIYGFGCHLDPEVALSRALTELNQSLEAVPLSQGPDAMQSYLGAPEAVEWWKTVTLENSPYLSAQPGAAGSMPADISTDDIRDDIEICLERARALGIEVLVLDQTRPDAGLPVVRVVAPGLRHFWARFRPGRLYDLPVTQGWRATPILKTALNPHVVQF